MTAIPNSAPPPPHPVPAIQDTETNEQRNARLAWRREARFGLFIHWGIYAVPAESGTASRWPTGTANGSCTTRRFRSPSTRRWRRHSIPTKFDAEAWVTLAKNAGMKYIVITTKHHDGFAMFNSKVDAFNIVGRHVPSSATRSRNSPPPASGKAFEAGFYYSQDQDWTAPGGAAHRAHWDAAQRRQFRGVSRQTKAIPQIEELLKNYQPYPAILWFDYPTANMTPELAAMIVEVLNRHPNLIWNNRLGGGYPGDTVSPEQHIPPQGYPGKNWETCMTMNDKWGYKSEDHNFKSTETLLHNLIDIASKGGNYLLNVGPDADGVIPSPSGPADRNRKWLAVNGEAIYGSGPTPFGARGFPAYGDWRCTTKPGKIFIHLFEWPGATFTLRG